MNITLIVSGESGAGKTHLGGTAEELGLVLYIWFPTIQPDNLLTLGNLDKHPNIILMPIQQFDDLLQVPKMVREVQPATTVIDPIDFAQALLKEELKDARKYPSAKGSPVSKYARAGSENLNWDGWGIVKTRVLSFVLSTNAQPCHKIYTTLVQRLLDDIAALEAARELKGKMPDAPSIGGEDERPYRMESGLDGAMRKDIFALMGPAGYANIQWRGSRAEYVLDFRPHPGLHTNRRGRDEELEILVNPTFKEVVLAFNPNSKAEKIPAPLPNKANNKKEISDL